MQVKTTNAHAPLGLNLEKGESGLGPGTSMAHSNWWSGARTVTGSGLGSYLKSLRRCSGPLVTTWGPTMWVTNGQLHVATTPAQCPPLLAHPHSVAELHHQLVPGHAPFGTISFETTGRLV